MLGGVAPPPPPSPAATTAATSYFTTASTSLPSKQPLVPASSAPAGANGAISPVPSWQALAAKWAATSPEARPATSAVQVAPTNEATTGAAPVEHQQQQQQARNDWTTLPASLSLAAKWSRAETPGGTSTTLVTTAEVVHVESAAAASSESSRSPLAQSQWSSFPTAGPPIRGREWSGWDEWKNFIEF